MDMKPPISRAKMILITKAAIKAIKLYKHVVQIVEKFIKKCKPEYKVPGLYVIDSIVRQSRHQFGIDKDVFGPRFTKNLTGTFQCLYLCPTEDKSKIVRVLNLWQKKMECLKLRSFNHYWIWQQVPHLLIFWLIVLLMKKELLPLQHCLQTLRKRRPALSLQCPSLSYPTRMLLLL